jgi:N-methylhydantoinase A
VTDAHLLLGRLPQREGLAGGVPLRRDLAERAIARLAQELGLDPLRTAQGILDVAGAEMLGALRALTIARGIDPRRYALMPFGGAGPLHATSLAAQLGIERVICPPGAGVLSALGLAAAAPRRDATGSFEAARVDALRERARAALGAQPIRERVRYALRYRGQSFELAVDAPADAASGLLRELFEEAHERAFGYRDSEGEVELVTVTVSVWGPAPPLPPVAIIAGARRSRTPLRVDGEEVEALLIEGDPAAGERFDGPAICARADSTLLIEAGWTARVLESGAIEVIRR